MSRECIMLVEDNPDHVELTLDALQEANVGNDVVVMNDGISAIDYLAGNGEYADRRQHPLPLLVMLDLKLPGASGKDVLRFIKGREELKHIPVVMLTSSAMDSDIEECYDLGANSYITKPVSFGEFVDKVKSIPLYWLLVNTLPRGDT